MTGAGDRTGATVKGQDGSRHDDATIRKVAASGNRKRETGTSRSPTHADDPKAPANGYREEPYFLRRLEAFFFACFLRRETCFFSRAISLPCLRAFARALLVFRLAAALTFFNAAALPEAFFLLRFAI